MAKTKTPKTVQEKLQAAFDELSVDLAKQEKIARKSLKACALTGSLNELQETVTNINDFNAQQALLDDNIREIMDDYDNEIFPEEAAPAEKSDDGV